jgi:drug/metabolite transporter (DMT)-like permease
LVKYTEHNYISGDESAASFSIHIFFAAACAGSLAILVQLIRGKIKLHYKNILAGILLGVPNFFSIYFFIRFLKSGFLQSSAGIPVTNIGIVLVSALAAMLFFREKPTRMRVVGLILSILAILLIAFGDLNGTGI